MKKKNNYHIKLIISFISLILLVFISIFLFKNSLVYKEEIKLDYKETGDVNYTVYLKDNQFYSDGYLKEGMQYITNLINYIDLDFKYTNNTKDDIKYRYAYDVKAIIKITEKEQESKVLYSNEEVLFQSELLNSDNNFNINENFKIDYHKYNLVVENFKKQYGIAVDSYLIITMDITSSADNVPNFSHIDLNNKLEVKIPLSKNTIEISKNSINDSDKYIKYNTYINNNTLFILFIATIVIEIILFIMIVIYIYKWYTSTKDLYDIKLKRILREYDRAIVAAKSLPNMSKFNIIEVSDFEELIDAKDNTKDMIIFVETIPGKESWFILTIENNLYRYILKINQKNDEHEEI